MFGPYFLAFLARASLIAGKFDQGLEALEEALAQVNRYGDRYYEAELVRLQGELLLARGEMSKVVEPFFHKALAIARTQQAKSLELRAAMSLARLWQQQDKQQPAYQLLAAIYAWFTEGLDTPDLREAKALLEELTQ